MSEDPFDLPFIPGLFNTQLADSIDEELRSGIQGQRRHIDAVNLRYPVPVKNLPKQFNPRFIENFTESDIPSWFFKTDKGVWSSILSVPLDQAGCGSCWAFSTATQFTDVIRFNLLKRYKDKACVSSVFFQPSFICTGDSQIIPKAKGAVVNPGDIAVYAEEIKQQISSYFTVAFSPKIGQVNGKTTLDVKCNDALSEWKGAISTPGRVPKLLSKDYNSCLGCQGNLILCPLMLFTGAEDEAPGNPRGASLLIDFPLHEWVCLWGNQNLRDNFCSPKFLSGETTFDFPTLYKADAYSYVTATNDFAKGKRPGTGSGVNTMSDWMRCAIYNYGPITIGFQVFLSFMNFFKKPENAKKIYSSTVFMNDYKANAGANSPLGGHAVVIVGWGEEPDAAAGGRILPYWVVRNSWGTKWADGGYFKIERDMDAKLNAAGLAPGARVKFESEFGSLYFAPGPNPELYDDSGGEASINDMKDFLIPVPSISCRSVGEHPELLELANRNCKCRCGTSYDAKSKNINGCEITEGDPQYKVIDMNTAASLSDSKSVAGCPRLLPKSSLKPSSLSSIPSRWMSGAVLLLILLAAIFIGMIVYSMFVKKSRPTSLDRITKSPCYPTTTFSKSERILIVT